MPDPASRTRVERLLRGDFRVDDLTRLFLYARDRCDGRESVKEVGDFVAHHNERNKGTVTRATREWFAISGFISRLYTKRYNRDRLPPEAPEFSPLRFAAWKAPSLNAKPALRASKLSAFSPKR